MPPSSACAPCAKLGRGFATPHPARCASSSAASQAIAPSASQTRAFDSARRSASSHSAQARISAGSGLLPGGAQRTAALIHTFLRRRPSPRAIDCG